MRRRTDAALAMAMNHVSCRNITSVTRFRSLSTMCAARPAVFDQVGKAGDLQIPGKFLTAADIGEESEAAFEEATLLDELTNTVRAAGLTGTVFQFEDGVGSGTWTWSSELVPALRVEMVKAVNGDRSAELRYAAPLTPSTNGETR